MAGSAKGSRPERMALVLQGGGALGAYQAGVYEGLAAHGCVPDWVAGTSIGAVNGALIVGNAPDKRVAKLREFWALVSDADWWQVFYDSDSLSEIRSSWSVWSTMTFGRPGFFVSRWFNPSLWLPVGSSETSSFYDTGPLRSTLERLVDFDVLNAGSIRLSLGAVNVLTGALRYFDTKTDRIGPDHVMASGALPPGFPAIRVEGELYWDGGIYSNTPLEVVLDDVPRVNTLAIMLSLFNPAGREPRSVREVETRRKDITYGSRLHEHVTEYRRIHNLRRALQSIYALLPDDIRENPEVVELAGLCSETTMHIVELFYPSRPWELEFKDADFSKAAVEARWKLGYRDGALLADRRPWEAPVWPHSGVVVHTVGPAVDPESGDLAFR